MRRYLIRWTEQHEAEIEARDEEDAYDMVYAMDPEITRQKTVHDEIRVLGGDCDKHGEWVAECDRGCKHESCPTCEQEPQGDGEED